MDAMAQQDKITTIDLIRAILAPNRAALALGISLAAVVLGTSLVPLVGDRMPVTAVQTDLAAERAGMMTIIETHAKEASTTLGRNYIAPEVLKAVSAVPRHEFVPDRLRGDAYADPPLPIGYGQTISQPFIVALMTDLVRVGPDDAVLEVGTGSGYQAAVLAHLARRVYTIEIVPGLADSAATRLQRLGYSNVVARTGDGYYGWEEAAPFDSIIVTAAASQIPPPLIRQLKPEGRMVIPVGAPFAVQYLVLVERDPDNGRVTTRQLLPVRFVPLASGGQERRSDAAPPGCRVGVGWGPRLRGAADTPLLDRSVASLCVHGHQYRAAWLRCEWCIPRGHGQPSTPSCRCRFCHGSYPIRGVDRRQLCRGRAVAFQCARCDLGTAAASVPSRPLSAVCTAVLLRSHLHRTRACCLPGADWPHLPLRPGRRQHGSDRDHAYSDRALPQRSAQGRRLMRLSRCSARD